MKFEDLTPRQREVMRLILRDGLTDEEIAARLGMTEGTVKQTALHARQRLASRVGDEHFASPRRTNRLSYELGRAEACGHST